MGSSLRAVALAGAGLNVPRTTRSKVLLHLRRLGQQGEPAAHDHLDEPVRLVEIWWEAIASHTNSTRSARRPGRAPAPKVQPDHAVTFCR